MAVEIDKIIVMFLGFFLGLFGYLIKDKVSKVEKIETQVGNKIDKIFDKISSVEKKLVEINSLRDNVDRLESRIDSIDNRILRIEKDLG